MSAPDAPRTFCVPALATPAYGGDWSPEQWDEATIERDLTLMREAGVNLVSIGIFSWARLEPKEGAYEFGWLASIIDRLYEIGICVDLATGTASPPAWMASDHPETLPVDKDGVRLGFGSRQQYCPSSTVYRERSQALAAELAKAFGDHPGVVLWHVGNEYACHVHECFCDVCAREFRDWLSLKYGSIDALNRAWGTDFWSQRYQRIEQVNPPAAAPTFLNPSQLLDWRRFSNHQILTLMTGEIDQLRAHSTLPVTTNFMSSLPWLDYREWATHLDLISDDSYPDPADPGSAAEIAWAGDLMRGLGDGAPWLLMEQSTGAVQWRDRNANKRPRQYHLWSIARLAHGADGILQFQWRQSARGAETFHAAMVAHAGKAVRTWQEIVDLGEDLKRLDPVRGTRTEAGIALIIDWESEWAKAASVALVNEDRTFAAARQWHRTAWEAGYSIDIVGPEADLGGYRVIVVPELVIDRPDLSERLAAAAAAGANVVVTGPAGTVDAELAVVLGGYLGSLQPLLGVRVLEQEPAGVTPSPYYPAVVERGEEAFRITRAVRVPATETWHGLRTLDTSATGIDVSGLELRGGVWAEVVGAPVADRSQPYDTVAPPDQEPGARIGDADVIAVFDGRGASIDLDGRPAITRRTTGNGAAWYVATDLDAPSRAQLLARIAAASGVGPVLTDLPDGVEATRRERFLFLLNHSDDTVTVPAVTGRNLLTDRAVDGSLTLGGRECAVIDTALS